MTEPTTTNKGLIIPNTGDLPGTWGAAAINPDMAAIDGMLGGVATISLVNTNVVLTVPTGFTATPAVGPTQAQNAILRFTGVLTAACVVTLPLPGFYIVENLCTVGAFYVALSSVAPGGIICAPPGEATHVYCDGIDVKYVDLGRIGSYMDLGTATVPAWISNCTVRPYLNCDGASFNASIYPVLNAMLGANYLPDLRGRSRAALNQGTNRINTADSLVDGDTLLAAGGADAQIIYKGNLPNYNLSVTDPGHQHYGIIWQGGTAHQGASTGGDGVGWFQSSTTVAYTNLTVSTGGSGTRLTTLPPTQICGLTLIRAG